MLAGRLRFHGPAGAQLPDDVASASGTTSGCAASAVAGACAVVMKDVPAWQIVAGNPAVPIGERVLASP